MTVLRRVRGAIGMGLTWAVFWALFGILIGVASIVLPWLPWGAFFRVFDAPLPALAVPGFVGGAIFSVVLGIAGRRRRFQELSMPRFAAWGALAGALLGALPFTVGTPAGLISASVLLSFVVPAMVLCAVSASGSLAIARASEWAALPPGGGDVIDSGNATHRTRDLAGRSD